MRTPTKLVIVAGALCALIGAACAGGGDGGTVVVDQYALDSLREYAFVSEIEVESDEGDLRATYDAVTEGLLAVQGSFSGEGDLLESLDLPPEADVIATDASRYWLREPDGEWAAVQFDGGERYNSLGMLNGLATPPIYLSYFVFGGLELVSDGQEEIRGLDTARVRLDREEIIALVPGLTHLSVPDQGLVSLPDEAAADFQQEAIESLPDDFAVETWVAKAGGYPVRIVIEFTVDEEGSFATQFPDGARVRLQMDITDTDADVDIQPPDA